MQLQHFCIVQHITFYCRNAVEFFTSPPGNVPAAPPPVTTNAPLAINVPVAISAPFISTQPAAPATASSTISSSASQVAGPAAAVYSQQQVVPPACAVQLPMTTTSYSTIWNQCYSCCIQATFTRKCYGYYAR